MIFLNILYGLVMAVVYSLAIMLWQWTADFNEAIFLVVWGVWAVGHILYDTLAHYAVKWFNRKAVYKG